MAGLCPETRRVLRMNARDDSWWTTKGFRDRSDSSREQQVIDEIKTWPQNIDLKFKFLRQSKLESEVIGRF